MPAAGSLEDQDDERSKPVKVDASQNKQFCIKLKGDHVFPGCCPKSVFQ
jgi:hypothetical protein